MNEGEELLFRHEWWHNPRADAYGNSFLRVTSSGETQGTSIFKRTVESTTHWNSRPHEKGTVYHGLTITPDGRIIHGR